MVLTGISKLLITRICIHVAVAVTVLYVQITHRPKETDTYYTNNPNDTSRAGVIYTCGCSLPTYLQSAENSVTSRSLNSCYEFSSLETVTVLMYSHSAAALVPNLQPRITELGSHDITYRTVDGYTVSQQAHDLSKSTDGITKSIVDEPLSSEVRSLFLNGYRQPDRYPSVNFLQSPDFTTFPKSYLRLTFLYDCLNCSTCDPLKVTEIFKQVTMVNNTKDEAWGTCFPWGGDGSCRLPDDTYYRAKCLLYPTEVLPANFAIQRFLDELLKLSGLSIDSSQINGTIGTTVLQPSSMYLNISQVENSPAGVQMGFVEVAKGSALWASLLSLFPTLDKCGASNNDHLEVCNGTSVCNVFTSADSYDLKCLIWKDTAQCEKLMGFSTTFDNAASVWNDTSLIPLGMKPKNYATVECLRGSNCTKVLPHRVIWKTSKAMEDDALNRFLSSRILNDYWAQRSGVCTNTYEHVVRYNPSATAGATATGLQGATNDANQIMFLETTCKWSTRDGTYSTANGTYYSTVNGTYCWLTGRYHKISDLPEEPWRTDLGGELFHATDRRFVCYKVKDQDLAAWFINVVGILFGWTGTVELLWKGVVIKLVTRWKSRREAVRVARLQSALRRGL